MRTVAVIEKGKDGTYSVFTPDLEHVIIGEGNTVAEAKADFENSVAEMRDCYAENELPDELRDLKIEYKFDVASVFEYLDFINLSKFAKRANINPSLLRQYKTRPETYISESRAKQIETALHKIGEELTTISL